VPLPSLKGPPSSQCLSFQSQCLLHLEGNIAFILGLGGNKCEAAFLDGDHGSVDGDRQEEALLWHHVTLQLVSHSDSLGHAAKKL
jgi:hypothetical protein